MDFNIFCKLDECVANYTSCYVFGNNIKELCLQLIADVTDEDKERMLNDFDLIIPSHIIFPHTYENGRMTVLFKEVI